MAPKTGEGVLPILDGPTHILKVSRLTAAVISITWSRNRPWFWLDGSATAQVQWQESMLNFYRQENMKSEVSSIMRFALWWMNIGRFPESGAGRNIESLQPLIEIYFKAMAQAHPDLL